MSFTTPPQIREQVQRLWDNGAILSAMVTGISLFPRKMTLKKPSSADLSRRFDEVRDWIAALGKAESSGIRIVWKEVNHRVIGRNRLPDEIWIDTFGHALSLIGKKKEAARFSDLITQTEAHRPLLLSFLARRPMKVMALEKEWPLFLRVIDWLQARPRPGIYLRQIDIPGIHTKFIEQHKAILSELFDLCLPGHTADPDATGVSGFCRRYGFRDKPEQVRFRIIDPVSSMFPKIADPDITLTARAFSMLDLPVSTVFITENEINFLAFPDHENAMVIFGKGYGFEMLKSAAWLHGCRVLYWGDIDTHGFAILDQLRAHLPHAESFLMDRETLMRHRDLWGQEPNPEIRDLPRLTVQESDLYDDLRRNRLGDRIRLEQEKIGFDQVVAAIAGF